MFAFRRDFFRYSSKLYINLIGGSFSVTTIVIGNEIGDSSSNPGRGCLRFTLC